MVSFLIKQNQRKASIYSKQLKRRITPAERILYEALVEVGADFQFQRTFYSEDKCYIADFYFKRKGVPFNRALVVEVDGKSHNSKRSKAYDLKRTQWLRSKRNCGMMRFTNDEIKNNVSEVVNKIITRNITLIPKPVELREEKRLYL